MTEIAEYFNRFYTIVLKQLISDPLVHSEWLYFLSMFKDAAQDKGRIHLYLGILGKDRNKRSISSLQQNAIINRENSKNTVINVQNRNTSISTSEHSHSLVGSSDKDLPIVDLKLKHRLSEKWKGNIDLFEHPTGQVLKLRKLTSEQNIEPKYHNQTLPEPKIPKNKKEETPYALPTSISPNVNQYLAHRVLNYKENKESQEPKLTDNHRRLCQISSRVIKIFEGNSGLRG